MTFKGRVERWEKDEYGRYSIFAGYSPNLFVDDGKEACLDAMLPETGGDGAWWENDNRYMGFGTCMFNNESFERASGMDAIPSGEECAYPVDDTWLVNSEDSFLSREIGQRVNLTITRRDQTVEMVALINCPGDVPVGTSLREFGIFLKTSGPYHDPSNHLASRPNAMLARTALFGTGWYYTSGDMCLETDSGTIGAELCYFDDPYVINSDVQLRWKFGEL